MRSVRAEKMVWTNEDAPRLQGTDRSSTFVDPAALAMALQGGRVRGSARRQGVVQEAVKIVEGLVEPDR